MTIVKQYNKFACVAACIESIKRDFGDSDFSHEDFVQDNLDIFNGGRDDEGCCDPNNIPEALKRAGLDCEPFADKLNSDLTDEAFLIYCLWKGDPTQNHCVRLIGEHQSVPVVMEPANGTEELLPTQFVKCMWRVPRP